MKASPQLPKFRPLPALLALLLVCAITFAAALSSSPQLHQRLHQLGSQTSHECAVTLLASGSVQNSICEPVLLAPVETPRPTSYPVFSFPSAFTTLEFSRLEHAPPRAA
ncbi:MAG: hypothetical protein ACR2F0_04015 [Chthoniobacterales bacterium]